MLLYMLVIVNTLSNNIRDYSTQFTRWPILKACWLCSLQPKMEELNTVSKNQTGSWLRLTVLLNCAVGEDSLRVPLITRKLNQSVLKKINPECSLEGLMVKLQYFGHLKPRSDSLGKTLMLGKIEDQRRRVWQRMRWLNSTINSIDMNWSKIWR